MKAFLHKIYCISVLVIWGFSAFSATITKIAATLNGCDKSGYSTVKLTVSHTAGMATYKLLRNGVAIQTKGTAVNPFTFDSLLVDTTHYTTIHYQVAVAGAPDVIYNIPNSSTYPTIPAPLTVTIQVTKDVTCAMQSSDASFGAVPAGGNGPYTYLWNVGATASQTLSGQPNAYGYIAQVTDANGCQMSSTLDYFPINGLTPPYTGPWPITIDGVTITKSCGTQNNGKLTVVNAKENSYAGVFSYSLLDTTSKATISIPGNSNVAQNLTGNDVYIAFVTNANGCQYTGTYTDLTQWKMDSIAHKIDTIPVPQVSVTATPATICFGYSSVLAATATVTATYSWSNNIGTASQTVTPAITTTYTVTGTSSGNGCATTATTTVTVNQLPTITATASSSPICAGFSSILTAGGGASYAWNNSVNTATQTVSPATTTIYSVTGTDAKTCTNTATATVTVNQLPTITASASATTICLGASSTLTAAGGSTYNWSNGVTTTTQTVSPATTTTYTLTGTDGKGCANTTSIVITVNPLPTVTATANPVTICVGQSSILTATGANSYSWNNAITTASQTVSPLATITYTVTGTDGNSCKNTATASVTVNPLPTIIATPAPASICIGLSSTLTAAGGISYNWDNGANTTTQTVSPIVTTVYTVSGTDVKGCVNTATTTVTVNPLPTVTATANPTIICVGFSSTLTATGGTTYVWSNAINTASQIVTPVTTNTYTVTATDAKTCVNTASVTVTVNLLPTVTATANPVTICVGQSSILTASGTNSYSWNNTITTASQTVSPVATITYTVTGTDGNSCTNTATATVSVNSLPTITATPGPASICIGLSSTLTAAGGISYNWNNGANTPTQAVSPIITTVYTVSGTDVKGCINTATTTVTVNPLPTVTASANPTIICAGFSSTLTATGGTAYAWSNAINTASQIVTPATTMTYTVTATDAKTCVNIASVTVTVNLLPTITATPSPANICIGSSSTLSASGGNSYAWNNSINTASQTVSPITTTIYTVTGTDGNSCKNTATTTITVDQLPTVSAGGNDTVCSRIPYTLSKASESVNSSNPVWTTSGQGSFNPLLTLNPVTYTLAGTDLSAASINLTITVDGTGACVAKHATSMMTLTINDPPTVVIADPNPAALCANNPIPITDATITNAGSISWSTSGSGSFNATTVSNPNYNSAATKNTTDILTVTVTGKKACNTPASATKTLTLDPPPTAFAGGDATNCNNGPYTFTKADTTNAALPLTWSTSGTGLFTTPNTLNPVYTPSKGDTLAGLVKLTITVNGVAACSAVIASSMMTLKMNGNVTADAGPNLKVCKGNDVHITKDTTTNQSSLLWTSPNGGKFSDATQFHPTYTPNAADIAAGVFTLTITANGVGACPPAHATTTVTLKVPPVANAGANDVMCFSSPSYTISKATATPLTYSNLQWTTTGGGTFDDGTILNPTYTPTPADIVAGSVKLTLQADGNADCLPNISSMTLSFDLGPQISAGNDTTICYGATVTMNSSKAAKFGLLTWSSTDVLGKFDHTNTLHPTYTPGANDLLANKATIILTASGLSACINAKDTAIVTILPQLTVSINNTTGHSTKCFASCDADAHVMPVGGDAPYTYSWSGPSAVTGKDTLLCKGTYSVTVIDVDGCSVSQSIGITQPDQILAPITPTNITKCFGDTKGAATVNASDAFYTTYNYNWSTGDATQTINNLPAGTYTVTVVETTDSYACSVTNSVTITQPKQLTASFTLKTPSCVSGQETDPSLLTDGQITANPSGGTGPGTYLYTWGTPPGGITNTITNITSGSYPITIVDANGCKLPTSAVLPTPTPLGITITVKNNKCYGDTLGSAIANVTGGTGLGTYQYYWDNGATTQKIEPLLSGTYPLQVLDNNNCLIMDTAVLVDPNKFSATVGQPTPFMITTNTKISVCFTGTYLMDPDLGFDLIAPDGKILTLSTSPAEHGTESCTGQDFNVCFTTEAVPTLNICGLSPATPLIRGNFAPEKPWSTIYGDNPDNGGWILQIEDWEAKRNGENVNDYVFQNASLSFRDVNSSNDSVTILYQGTGFNTVIKNLVTLSSGPGLTDFTVPLHLTTKCYNSFDANVIVFPKGGTPPFTSFVWDDALSGKPAAYVDNGTLKLADSVMLKAGNYTMVATDGNGCQATSSVNVDQPKKIGTKMDSVNTTCLGSPIQTGAVTVHASGDFPIAGLYPFKYAWALDPKDSIDSMMKNLPGGKYIVSVTDANGCTTTDSTTVEETIKVFATIKTDSIKCFGDKGGNAYLSPYTKNLLTSTKTWQGAYSYTWGPDSTLKNQLAGVYPVTITDTKSCQLDTFVTIVSPKAVTFDSVIVSNPTCQLRTDAKITAYISGGTPSYSYAWTNGIWIADSTRNGLVNIGAGTYNVTVTDKYGCFHDTTIFITDPPVMVSTLTATDTVTCWGDTTAKINASVVHGTAPYTFTWSNGKSGVGLDSIYNLGAGSYTLTISDKYNCKIITDTSIATHSQILITKVTTKNPTCSGDLNGLIKITATGGIPSVPNNYTYQWDKDGLPIACTTTMPLNLSGGNYTVTITDKVGCTLDSTIKIVNPAALQVSFNMTDTLKFSGDTSGYIKVIIANGTNPLTYTWQNGNKGYNISAKGDSLFDLGKGTYYFTVTDFSGCTIIDSATIYPRNKMGINLHIAKALNCPGDGIGSVYVTEKGNVGAVSYQWYKGGTTMNGQTDTIISNLPAGWYTVHATDSKFTIIDSIQLIDPTPLKVQMSSTNVTCFGLNTGIAKVTVTNGVIPDSILWTDASQDTLVNKLWKLGQKADSVTNIVIGTYSATLTYNGTCKVNASTPVSQNPKIVITTNEVDATCNNNNGQISASTLGGVPFASPTSKYKYIWYPIGMPDSIMTGNTTNNLTNLGVDYYDLTVTDSLGCTATAQIEVKDNGGMAYSVDSIRFPTCPSINNGYYRIKPSANPLYKYSFWSFTGNNWWTDTAITSTTGAAKDLSAGTYKVYITNNPAKNCKEVVLFNIGNNYLTAVSNKGDITCPLKPDGWAKVTASQGLPYLHAPKYRYNWSTGATTDSIFGLAAGNYSVSVTDSINCQIVINTITIISPPDNMSISLPNDTALTYCYSDSTKAITVSVVSGIALYTYDWDKGVGPKTATVPKLGLGWHYVTVKDIGCYTSRNDSIFVEEKGFLSFKSIDTTFTPCGQALGTASVKVKASSLPVTYLWSTNDITDSISKLAVGYYGVTATDANSCILIDTVQISDTSHIKFNVIVNTNIHCAGKSIGIATVKDTVGGNGHFSILWGDGETAWKATALSAGITSVSVTDFKSCIGLNKVQILQDSVFSIDKFAVIADASCGAGSPNGSAKVSLFYGMQTFVYVWQDSKGSTIVGYTGDSVLKASSGIYNVSVTDASNCQVAGSITINKNSLQVDSVLQTNISCNGAKDGTIKVAPKLGSGWGTADSYNWSTGSTIDSVFNLDINKYYVTLTEAGNTSCLAIDSFTITQPFAITAKYQILQNISCVDSLGKITAHVSGGTSPYSFLWNNKTATTDSTFTNYWTTSYNITVTDKNNCQYIGTTNSTDTSMFTIKPGTIVPITCFGQAMGALSVDTAKSMGVLPYIYTWSHNALLDTLAATNLPFGTYSVTVTDDSSCVRSINFGQLTQPGQIKTVFTYPPIIQCNGDSVTVSAAVNGGIGGYTYQWFKQALSAGGNVSVITNATAGQYVLNITDSKNCSVNDTVTLTQAPPIDIDTTLAYSGCGFGFSNGSIKINSISGLYPPFTFKWFNGNTKDTSLLGLAAGKYTLTITDNVNCVSVKNISILSLNFDSAKIDTIQMPLCQFNSPTGDIAINVWGSAAPYNYAWTLGANSIGGDNLELKNILPGFYRVTVTSKTNGCFIKDSVLLQPRVTLDASIIVKNGDTTQYQICYGDSTRLTGDPKPTVILGKQPLPPINEKYVWGVYQNNSDSALATLSSTSGKTVSVKPFATTTYYVRYSEYGCYTQPKTVEISQFNKVGLNIQILIDNQIFVDSTAIPKGFELSLKPKADPWFITKNAFVPGFVQYVWTSYDSLKGRDGIINLDTINQAYYDTTTPHTVALQRLRPEHTTWYYVTGLTNIGCYEKDSVKITVVLGYTIPNAFSPNGDGRNDIWHIPYIEQFPDARVTIFNRWGIVVWEKDKDYNLAPFVGKDSKNKDLSMGTYYYLIDFNDTKGTKPRSGSITIVR